MINSEDAAVSTLVDRQFVSNLPLNGRTFQSLILLTPGIVPTQASGNNNGQFSVNGQRTDTNYFTIDGASANFGIEQGISVSEASSAAGALPAASAGGP